MFKWNAVNITSIIIAAGVAGGVIYINSSTWFASRSGEGTANAPVVGHPVVQNPLAEASKQDVSRWFPGTCFAEIYMQSSSYGGALVQGCIERTAREIQSEKGVQLSAEDFRSPDVVKHFKSIYGAAPWRT
ncbi:hypothetical protein [Pseudomonas gingeri]